MVMISSNELFTKLRRGDTNLLLDFPKGPNGDYPELLNALNIFHRLAAEVVNQMTTFLENACEEVNYMVCCMIIAKS